MISKIKPGPMDTLVLFSGACDWLPRVLDKIASYGIHLYVFSVNRHLNEIIEPRQRLTFRHLLDKEKIQYYQVADINKSAKLREIVTDKSVGFGLGESYTFSKKTLRLFKGRIFDFMIIRMPKYRGGAHYTWQILRNSRIGCFNIQLVNEDMVPGVYDSGLIIKTHEYIIPRSAKTPLDYIQAAQAEVIDVFNKFVDEIQLGREFELNRLQENFSEYYPRLFSLKHGFIDWSWSAEEIERFINAFDEPYVGASTYVNGMRVFIKDCQRDFSEGNFHPFMRGLIYRIDKVAIFVAVKDGSIIIKKVTDEKGKDISSRLKVGQRFHTDTKRLEEAMLFKANYDSEGLGYRK
jgi:methionyl-tRNA formyltransferase